MNGAELWAKHIGDVETAMYFDTPEALYAAVREAYEDLEVALEAHERFAATAAAFEWWAALDRLMQR